MLNRLASPRGDPLLTRGIANGLIGAAVVAVWFFLMDSAAGRPLHTPAALGSALFLGAQNAHEIQFSLGVIAAYSVVHIVLFTVMGVLFVAAADYLERVPSRVLLVALGAIVVEGTVLPVLALEAAWVLGSLGLWTILVANVLSVSAMAWHVMRTHPALRQLLAHSKVDV